MKKKFCRWQNLDNGVIILLFWKETIFMNKKILSALLVCVALFAPMTTCAAAEATPPILSVSGSGRVQSAPDQAAITLGVVTRAETAGEAQQENAAKATAIRSALTALGIEERDIKTEDYSFRPEYSRERNERNTIVGYTASNTIRVRVRDVALVGDVVDAVLANGANTIHSLDFSIRDTDALRKKALESAVKDARQGGHYRKRPRQIYRRRASCDGKHGDVPAAPEQHDDEEHGRCGGVYADRRGHAVADRGRAYRVHSLSLTSWKRKHLASLRLSICAASRCSASSAST
jgi:hypothetical protein